MSRWSRRPAASGACAWTASTESRTQDVGFPAGAGRPATRMGSIAAAHSAPAQRQGFAHEALLYEDLDHFLDATASFLEEALEADAPALVVVDAAKIGLLKERLNGDAGRIQFADM